MTKKKQLIRILAIAGLVLAAMIAYLGFQVLTGRTFIDLGHEPIVKELITYVKGIQDVDQIEVIYRPQREWIRGPQRNPEYKEVVVTITNPDEIEQIMNGFKKAKNFYSCWTQCGFYFRLDFYGEDELFGTILVGFDDCKSFTTSEIKAVGEMNNDFFYREYVVPMR